MIWIVWSTHCIDIVAFHKNNVPKHVFLCYRPAFLSIKFMSVDSFYNETFSIQTHNAIQHFKTSETNQLRNNFNRFSSFIFHKHKKLIQMWFLCTPRHYCLDFGLKRCHHKIFCFFHLIRGYLFGMYMSSLPVCQNTFNAPVLVLFHLAAKADPYVQRTRLIIF